MYYFTKGLIYMVTPSIPMAQVKFVVPDELAERFKRAVLRKHGKLALSEEGAKAMQMYLEQERTPVSSETRPDPLLSAIGLATSKSRARPSARRDKDALYEA